MTAPDLAAFLSEITGLDFIITAAKTQDGWIIDWSADSTLIAGLDDRAQKDRQKTPVLHQAKLGF